MSTRLRGLLVLLGIVVVSVVFCAIVPFVVMPSAGVGVGLPVIEVPGEVVQENFLFGVNLTNTIIGTVVADILILLFLFLIWRASKGWTQEVPGRFQSWVEFFLGGFYNFLKGIGGERLRTAPYLWPLAATIFLLLLTGNWMKLLPGVETVGKFHCAYEGQSGYPMQYGLTDGSYTLFVDTPLNAGTTQTAETYEVCNTFFKYKEWERYPLQTAEEIQPQLEEAQAIYADAQLVLSNAEADLEAIQAELEGVEEPSSSQEESLAEAEAAVTEAEEALKVAGHEVERQELRLEFAEALPALEDDLFVIDEQIAELEGAAAEGADEEHGEEAAAAEDVLVTETEAQVVTLEDLQEQRDLVLTARNEALTQIQFPTATITFTPDQLDSGAVPFIFHITPFVRGPATDLSLAFMLAILAMVAVQVYGVIALGPAYFEKFINISALGNLGKKPLGAIDFIVGLIEIISEIGKIISLAFRLFGNLFAGGVALMAVTFLVALLVPGVIYLLEIIIGSVQALVFAVLTVVFATQAMEAHHGDDHDHAEEH